MFDNNETTNCKMENVIMLYDNDVHYHSYR